MDRKRRCSVRDEAQGAPGTYEDAKCSNLSGQNNAKLDSGNPLQSDVVISMGQIKLLEDFVEFCKSKRAKYEHKSSAQDTSLDYNIPQGNIICSGSGSSKFSPSYFSKVITSLTPHQREVIDKYGFSCLLKFDHCYVPKRFANWIARQTNVESSEIKLGDKLITISKESVNFVLDLPISGKAVILDREAGRSFLLSKFQLSIMPSVTFFGNMLRREDLSDDMIFWCFMIVALSSFLAPNSSMKPSSKY